MLFLILLLKSPKENEIYISVAHENGGVKNDLTGVNPITYFKPVVLLL